MKLLPMRHTPQSCQWSVPTLLMPPPYWLSASEAQWSCWNDRQILVLSSTEICVTCPMWKPLQEDSGKIQSLPRQGAMPFREP